MMPIYEWECAMCGTAHDELESVASTLEKKMTWCEPCGKQMLHWKRIGPTSFHLKGRGWAKDGYENPLRGDELANVSGDKFLEEYRKQVRDPEHPRKVGDILKATGRGNRENLSDIGDPRFDVDAERNSKRTSGVETD